MELITCEMDKVLEFYFIGSEFDYPIDKLELIYVLILICIGIWNFVA